MDDECVEDKESFEVSLTTSDEDVDIHISSTNIVIIDNDGIVLVPVIALESLNFPSSLPDALFKIQQNSNDVAENNRSIPLCVELVNGCLQRRVHIDYETLDATALSELTAS